MIKREQKVESAKRTIGNSPAIYRWVTRKNWIIESAKRTAEIVGDVQRADRLLSPVPRALGLWRHPFPSTEVLGYFRSSASRTLIFRRPDRMAPTFTALTAVIFAAACSQRQVARTVPPLRPPEQQTEIRALPANSSPNHKLVIDGAIDQVGKTTGYDPSYQKIDYPNGDVPIETGVCSDVIVRAFRKANIDLQKEVHEDMKANFSAYPTKWGLSGTDPNIDHRRVPNLQTFLGRKGKEVATTGSADTFMPGDVVTWDLGGGVDHIGIVVNVWYKPSQRYLIVHNIGAGTRMEDVLFAWKITGHYRYF